jgi:DNA topoisomerase VI subunit A
VPTRLGCVLVTGCGMPDFATRAFVAQLSRQLALPVLGLADLNPFGLGIMACYRCGHAAPSGDNSVLGVRSTRNPLPATHECRFGSRAAGDRGAYAVPDLQWLGLSWQDVDEHGVPAAALQPLTRTDEVRAHSLLAHEGVAGDEEWVDALHTTLRRREKMELEGALALGVNFLSDALLPGKVDAALHGVGTFETAGAVADSSTTIVRSDLGGPET